MRALGQPAVVAEPWELFLFHCSRRARCWSRRARHRDRWRRDRSAGRFAVNEDVTSQVRISRYFRVFVPVTGSPVQGSRDDRRGKPQGLSRRHLLIGFGIAVVVFDLVLTLIDRRLTATGGPSILGLEFAGNAARAHQIMAEWGDHGRYLARLSLWIDFGFMASYGVFFALAGFATRDFARANGRRALALAGVAAPYCAIAAAVFDAAENIIWLLVLGGHGGKVGPPMATSCASLKFLLIGIAIIYALWGLGSRFLSRRRRS
jgi:hypothetical protein